MSEMNGADPTRPIDQAPPGTPEPPQPPPAPGKELAVMGGAGAPTGPDPSDLELFADGSDPTPGDSTPGDPTPGASTAASAGAAGRLSGTNPRRLHGLPGRLPPEGLPNGLGWPGGSVGPQALLPVPPPGLPPGPGPGALPGGRAPFEESAPRSRSLWFTVLAGVAALACGATLVVVAGQPDRRAEEAAAPVTDASVPGLRGYPERPDGNPGDGGDSAGSLSDPESPASGIGHDETANNQPPRAAQSKAPGTPDASAAGPGADEDGSGAESGTGSRDDPETGAAGGPGSGGNGGGGDGGTVGKPTTAPTRKAALQAVNYPDRYWHVRGNGLGYLDPVSRSEAAFTVKAGLADAKCYSFTLSNGRYLRHAQFRLRADSDDGSGTFRKDATFCPRTVGNGTIMLESVNYPGRFVRHRDFQLFLDPYQHSGLYRADTAFRMVAG
ncbi:AbfB domain-containing protein [Streptomyces sp. JV176]|uniref:AbfB domain-containing protein n=1 Tax=Streptomyces sp. JV176 TaxID=858630 RepID=UPI002E77206D|nr:AbfB domain-containing protein [Streptomyces sp. JV176]MEE1799925.1 AbfB domain-containing protein [Streptomyces sp. JV176]